MAYFNPFNAELNPICQLLALLGAHHILHISRIRVKYFSRNNFYANFSRESEKCYGLRSRYKA